MAMVGQKRYAGRQRVHVVWGAAAVHFPGAGNYPAKFVAFSGLNPGVQGGEVAWMPRLLSY